MDVVFLTDEVDEADDTSNPAGRASDTLPPTHTQPAARVRRCARVDTGVDVGVDVDAVDAGPVCHARTQRRF